MGYFPFFMEIEGKKGVIIGGGKQAVSKAEKLLLFGPDLLVIAPQIDERILALEQKSGGKVKLLKRRWEEADLEQAAFVVAALEDHGENAQIARWCQSRQIPVNAVDQPKDCSFYFPGIIKDGPLTVAVSSDGKCPAAVSWVRKKAKDAVPDGIGAAIELLGQLRPELVGMEKDFSARAKLQERLLEYCLEQREVSLEKLREYMEMLCERADNINQENAADAESEEIHGNIKP